MKSTEVDREKVMRADAIKDAEKLQKKCEEADQIQPITSGQIMYAKPDQTLEEHRKKVLEVLALLRRYGYIEDDALYQLAYQACFHHDDGKVSPPFQRRVTSKKKIRFDSEKEVPHNILSGFLLNRAEFENLEDYYRVLFAVMYHHDYGDPYEIAREKKALIEELLQGYSCCKLLRSDLNKMQRMLFDDTAIKIKGYLHKCDYSASGGYVAEYPNDFLESSMENIKNKWRAQNPDSDWNDLQRFCMERRNRNIIAVAQTGMGKTEAGLQWIGNAKGYFVLPLRTAINAIYDRVKNDILMGESIDTRLAVLHSESLEYYSRQLPEEEMDIMEYEKRGKRFSIPLNISTMDQLFDFVFKYQGYELKLATLAYSRIVVDEIQMYDPELLAYLIYGLKRITQLGGKIAILTATLSPFMKESIRKEIPIEEENIGIFTNDMVRHHVKIRNYKMETEEIRELYYKNEKEGKSNKILVVCNSTKNVQAVYEELQRDQELKDKLHILHSRFTKADRAVLEKEILKFGSTYNEQGELDHQSGIWICTSLVEASLDIDFDYLFTELQDLNSLLQRLGRCNRKGKKDISEPNCFVYTEIDGKLLNSQKGFIDDTIYFVSKKAMQEVEGRFSEKQKIDLLNKYLTMENLKGSDYYTGKHGYQKTLEWIDGIECYQYKKEDNRLRNILSQDIIPSPVYELNKGKILEASRLLEDMSVSMVDAIRAKETILNYSVSIPYYQWLNYCKAVKKDMAEAYSSVSMGRYGTIPVMECSYDELGYHQLEYKSMVRPANML